MAEWLRYANKGKVRDQPLSQELIDALAYLPELGIEAEVFSGGQPPKGSGLPRTGSTRHDHGNAADVSFYRNGERLDWRNPEHIPVFQEIVRRGRERGITGFGAGPGYMAPGSMHIGFGNPAVWGDNGKGANAPDWLREAYQTAQATESASPELSYGNTIPPTAQAPDPMRPYETALPLPTGTPEEKGPDYGLLRAMGQQLQPSPPPPTPMPRPAPPPPGTFERQGREGPAGLMELMQQLSRLHR